MTTTARSAGTGFGGGFDPFQLADVLSTAAAASAFSSSTFSLADALESVDVGAAASAADAASDAAASTADAAAAAANNPGWFGFLTGPIEGLLQIIHGALVGLGASADAWGVSIIMMTVIIKVLTFPLTKTQLESTNKMQLIQPAVKELQAKYQSNPEVMNQKIAELYQNNEINPLAGCLPSLVQIPVFIGLYRAVLELAKDNKLDEPFLWLPNLEGPTYGADPAHGSDWILTGWCVLP
jgi:YidC/Oxa1 family membrane protein insertase